MSTSGSSETDKGWMESNSAAEIMSPTVYLLRNDAFPALKALPPAGPQIFKCFSDSVLLAAAVRVPVTMN